MIHDPSRLIQRRVDPHDAGRAAYHRGEGWCRCPRYTCNFDRQRWQLGWESAHRESMAAARRVGP